MSQKQQFMSQKQQNQETQNQQQQFRNPIFLSKQSQTQEKTMENQQQMSQKQQQTTLQKQQSQGTQNQQFRKPTWRPNVYDPFGNFPYYRMDVDQEPPEEKQNDSERKSFYYPIFQPMQSDNKYKSDLDMLL